MESTQWAIIEQRSKADWHQIHANLRFTAGYNLFFF
jgi:hypothetical protein